MKRFQFIAYGTVLWALLIASVQAQEEAVPDNDPDTPAETDGGALSLQELQTFADVFQQIRAGYVEEVADSTLFEYAVRGMLEGLDPHSAYLTREAYSDLQTTTEGEFSGLGIEIGRRGSYIEIIAPIDGSPAVEA
ncbi:MAG: S41 family peptidase, partial [Luminiphilus sp.]